jgi:hypothetical protein
MSLKEGKMVKFLIVIVICLSNSLNQVKALSVEELKQLVLDQFTESYTRIIEIEKKHADFVKKNNDLFEKNHDEFMKKNNELVTALQNQDALIKTMLKNYNELQMETENLKLQYRTLEMYSKLTLPETCSALKKTGLNKSVTAMINPAGLEQMFSAMEVRCDLPEDKTYLGKETKIEVVNCETLGCYNQSLDYNTSNEQIEALISSSLSCRQVIKLECVLAPIVDLVSIALLT